jgi:putative methionine-R-sulfoxide reductase with GAF domain
MTLDRNTKMLHIKAARKLGADIVHNTQIKMGEGIAGLAAATFKSIILPKDKEKSGVSERMKRKEINSSLIMPFPKANQADLYGVINLNIVRKGIDFSEKDIALVKELVNMASIALAPIKQPGTVCKIE